MRKVVVIGAGQAGSSCVAKLRSGGFDGKISLIGAESVPPYQRPPLSKKYLLGEMELARLFLRPETYYVNAGISLHLDQTVTTIDRTARTVSMRGRELHYDELVLTTGSTPRCLPARIGGDLEGVYLMRDLLDVDAIRPELKNGARCLIVGGGYIGLEVAAVAASRNVHVTLVEIAERILQRVAAPDTSGFFRSLHRQHGVDIREGAGLERLLGDERVTGARLDDGSELEVDFVIVGVGIVPATSLAEAAGLAIDNGIVVDQTGRTSDPHIWAAGDCASFPHAGKLIRLECVPNAIDMAECVADNIMGSERAYRPRPWFWSDQYDIKLQIAGLNTGYDRIVTRPGNSARQVSFWYYKEAQLLAVDAVNDPRAFMAGRRLIESGKSPEPQAIANPRSNLKTLL